MGKPEEPRIEPLWTADQVAEYLQASRAWVHREARAGRLPSRNILGLRRFDPVEIRKFNAGQKH